MQKVMLYGLKIYLNALECVSPSQTLRVLERLFSSPRARPFGPRDLDLLTQGRAHNLAGLAATIWGEGEQILLVHGWQNNRASLGAFVGPLLERGLGVVAFDAPAHGDSPGNSVHPSVYSQKILEVATELGPLRGVVGHSMGGGATAMALSEGLNANKVVLLAPAVDWSHQIRHFTNLLGVGEKLTQQFIEDQLTKAGLGGREYNAQRFGEGLKMSAQIYHDPADPRVPLADSEALTKYWQAADLIRFDGVGHGRILRNADIVASVVDFLAA